MYFRAPTQVDFQETFLAGYRKQGMSLPREVLPGRTYMITRRCSERRFLLCPDYETKDGTMPEVATLTISRPRGFDNMSDGEFAALIKMRVTAAEESAAAGRRKKGIRVLGRERILNQDWRARPKSAEPHFNLSPRVAAKNKWARIEALARNTAFLAVYLDARDKFAKGSRDVVFPAGTWGLRRYVNVQCSEAAPAPAPE
jgi:hypothetical protein